MEFPSHTAANFVAFIVENSVTTSNTAIPENSVMAEFSFTTLVLNHVSANHDTIILDSGASTHFCGNTRLFTTFAHYRPQLLLISRTKQKPLLPYKGYLAIDTWTQIISKERYLRGWHGKHFLINQDFGEWLLWYRWNLLRAVVRKLGTEKTMVR